jgi:prophage antirepressor-like protein
MSEPDPAPIRTRVMSALAAHDVRVLHHGGAAWFPVNDLVSALGVHRRTLDHHVGHLPDSERRHLPRPSRLPPDITIGNVGLHCVSLAGLFSLLMRTDGNAAAAFREWVCQSVLLPMWQGAAE